MAEKINKADWERGYMNELTQVVCHPALTNNLPQMSRRDRSSSEDNIRRDKEIISHVKHLILCWLAAACCDVGFYKAGNLAMLLLM